METQTTPYGTVVIGEQEALFRKAVELAEQYRTAHDVPVPAWAMAGGSTPKAFFKFCAENDAIPKPFIEHGTWFTSDERMVQTASDESNFGNLDRLLLRHYGIREENKYPWPTDMAPNEAAHVFNDLWNKRRGPAKCFDVCFLGMGDDCHTASLFPDSPLISRPVETNFAAVEVPGKGHRLTVTPHGLSRCGTIVVMVTGESKALPLASVFSGLSQPLQRPIQILGQCHDKVHWLIDPPAASRIADQP